MTRGEQVRLTAWRLKILQEAAAARNVARVIHSDDVMSEARQRADHLSATSDGHVAFVRRTT